MKFLRSPVMLVLDPSLQVNCAKKENSSQVLAVSVYPPDVPLTSVLPVPSVFWMK